MIIWRDSRSISLKLDPRYGFVGLSLLLVVPCINTYFLTWINVVTYFPKNPSSSTSCWISWHAGKSLNLYVAICKTGQCRTSLWPAVPDWPWLQECRCRMTQLSTGQNADAGKNFFSAFLHLLMICQHNKVSLTPHTAENGRTGCILVHHQQYGRAGCLSTINRMDVQGVFLLPAIRTCRVYAFQPASGQLCKRRKNNVDGGTSPVPDKEMSPVPE